MVVCYKRNVEYVDNPESAAVHCGAVRGSRGQWRAAAGSGEHVEARAVGQERPGAILFFRAARWLSAGGLLPTCQRVGRAPVILFYRAAIGCAHTTDISIPDAAFSRYCSGS